MGRFSSGNFPSGPTANKNSYPAGTPPIDLSVVAKNPPTQIGGPCDPVPLWGNNVNWKPSNGYLDQQEGLVNIRQESLVRTTPGGSGTAHDAPFQPVVVPVGYYLQVFAIEFDTPPSGNYCFLATLTQQGVDETPFLQANNPAFLEYTGVDLRGVVVMMKWDSNVNTSPQSIWPNGVTLFSNTAIQQVNPRLCVPGGMQLNLLAPSANNGFRIAAKVFGLLVKDQHYEESRLDY